MLAIRSVNQGPHAFIPWYRPILTVSKVLVHFDVSIKSIQPNEPGLAHCRLRIWWSGVRPTILPFSSGIFASQYSMQDSYSFERYVFSRDEAQENNWHCLRKPKSWIVANLSRYLPLFVCHTHLSSFFHWWWKAHMRNSRLENYIAIPPLIRAHECENCFRIGDWEVDDEAPALKTILFPRDFVYFFLHSPYTQAWFAAASYMGITKSCKYDHKACLSYTTTYAADSSLADKRSYRWARG